jgi:D-alanine--D-alanine ligase
MSRIKVGVVRGGPSSEYDVSLKTGGEVLKHLPKKYEGVDVLLDKESKWHLNGFPKEPAQVFDAVDVIFNAMHGEFGEDGQAQHFLDSFNIPYTGSGAFSSAMAMKKHLAYDVFSRLGIKTPRGKIFEGDDFLGIDAEDCAQKVFNVMPLPWVVKPASVGSSVGINICNSFPELVEAINKAFKYGNVVLVEEYINGREATCGVLDKFRGEKHHALPVIEIIPPKGRFFDYEVN